MKKQKSSLAAVREALGGKALKPQASLQVVGGLRDGYPEGCIGG